MKRTLKSLAAIALIALSSAACQKEQLFDSQTAGEETVTFTVQTDLAATKAAVDGDGDGAGLERCLVAVYMHTGDALNPYKLYDTPTTTKQDNEHYSFSVNLIRKQTYQIVVWADKEKYIVDRGLTSISREDGDLACNSDAYDAFFASEVFTQGTTASTAIVAKRPFAQLNLITTDLRTGFEPSDIKLTYTANTKFNALTKSASDQVEVTYSSAEHYYETLSAPGANTVAMNYLFASEEQAVLSEVKLGAKFTDDVDITVANVPVKRNYRTNIKGNLFTEQTDFTITVDADWLTPEIGVDWVSVATVAEANAALSAGTATNVSIESVADGSVIVIPETSNTIGIALPSGNASALTIQYQTTSDTGQTPNLNVSAENNTGDLVINAPQSHVTLNGTTYNSVTASTSSTTLVVEEGVVIENLTLNQGAVEIYGTVNTISANGCPIKVWAVGDKATFNKAYTEGAETIQLKNDITDFTDVILIGRSLNIDGQGHEIWNTANRVIRITQPDLTLNFTNVTLTSKCTAGSDVRCVSFDNTSSRANVVFDNCKLSASFYSINVATGPENLNIVIKNGTVVSGWAAINSYANNSTITVENSVLNGLNDKGVSGWNNFATIVLDGNNYSSYGQNNTVNIVNSTIYASSQSSNKQAWICIQRRAAGNVVRVDSNTKILDKEGNDKSGVTTLTSYLNEIWLDDYNLFPGLYQKDGVYHINSTTGLIYFSQMVNTQKTFSGKTVLLDNDLDMSGIDFTPISNTIDSYPSNSFAGTFDGHGHTIANLKASSDEVKYAAAGLFGTLTGTVKNVNLTNVDITSSHYAGGVVGYISSNTGATVQNCTVKGGSITATPELIGEEYDNGDKVGGVVGYITYGDYIRDCAVSDLTITAYRDLGGIVGCTSGTIDVLNCTVGENVNLVVDNTHNYKNYTENASYNAGSIIGRDATGTATTTGSTGTVTITYPY